MLKNIIALAAGIFVNDMTIPHAVEATLEGAQAAVDDPGKHDRETTRGAPA